MPRTTLNIEQPILDQISELQKGSRKSQGQIVSELLAIALADKKLERGPVALAWRTKAMGAKVDLSDKEAVYAALDR